MNEIIAERELLYQPKGTTERKALTIRIGRPYWLQPNVAACPVEWSGLFDSMSDIQGADLLQALQLAADVDPMLRALSNKFKFFFPEGDPYFDEED